jgi:phage terminase small subunit
MTPRQTLFLVAYLASPRGNAKLAATVAGYAWPARQGPRLTTFPEIAEAIRAGRERQTRERLQRWAADRRAREKRLEAEIEREWQSMPAWYRLGSCPRRPAGGAGPDGEGACRLHATFCN